MPPTVESVLAPGGAIAARLNGYECRPQQLQMSQAVECALAEKRHLLVEAGTGVGKSFAYLVPAILAAVQSKDRRVIISTHTISLQEQLIHKDIPFLQSVLDIPFSAVLVKGRSNYLSLRRLRVGQQRTGMNLTDADHVRQLTSIGHWSMKTRDGSRSDLNFTPAPPVWEIVESDSGNCLGKKCGDFEKCFYFKARKSMYAANLLIVNHALFFSDLAVRRDGGSFLPNYSAVVFDEAHTLEDVASDHLGLKITRGGIDYLLNKLYNPRTGRGMLGSIGDMDAMKQVEVVRTFTETFFRGVIDWLARQPRPGRGGPRTGNDSLRVREPNCIGDPLTEELRKLSSAIEKVAAEFPDEMKIEYEAVANRALGHAEAIRHWLSQDLQDQVYWVELAGQRVSLESAPIDVGPVLRELLFSKVHPVVLTSATLSSGGAGGFGFVQQRLGIDDAAHSLLGSPFNYHEQAELHLFRQMPDPSADPIGYDNAVIERIPEYVRRTQGRAFVLFTSYSAMQKAAGRLRDRFSDDGLTLMTQADGLPRSQLLSKFRSTKAAVLFGVDSFWQGVDVPGDALCNVIITKLPFTAPDRPVLAARMEAIQATGGQPFLEYQVPQAVLKLKQGFGRLIRTATDRGIVVIFDPRLLTKPYGRNFLRALPDCKRFVDGVME